MNVVGGFLEILQTAKDQGLSLEDVIKVIKESDADDTTADN